MSFERSAIKHCSGTVLWTDKISIILYKSDGKRKVLRKKSTAHELTPPPPLSKYGCHSSRMNSELRSICSEPTECLNTHWLRHYFVGGHIAKATMGFFRAKKWNIFDWPRKSPILNRTENVFHLLII